MNTTTPGAKHYYGQQHHTHTSNLSCYVALSDKVVGMVYTDAAGALTVRCINICQYYFAVYDYNTNFIFLIPIKDVTDASMIDAFQKMFNKLKDPGYKPTFNITNNQATKPITKFLKTEECRCQFVELHNH